jgi:ABC-2 type transport system ATP-binding protein
MEQAIEVKGLHKSYGDVNAVRGIDFEVAPGEVFGLLGPNGAGKTTTVEILEGLRPRTSGDVKVLGRDPGIEVKALKDRIGVCLQSTNLPDKITVREALALFSSFYSRNTDIDTLIDRLQLSEKRHAYYQTLSGGQKQRVALALALVNDPQMVFLDEPTTGLDPQVRLEIHSLISELRDAKRTILITTHYIEEAERLCDRVAIMDHGKILALDTPAELKRSVGADTIVTVKAEGDTEALAETFTRLVEGITRSRIIPGGVELHLQGTDRLVPRVVAAAESGGFSLADLSVAEPTLETVFIGLTGKELRD